MCSILEVNAPRSLPVIGQGLIIKPDAEGFMDQVFLKHFRVLYRYGRPNLFQKFREEFLGWDNRFF